MKQLKQEIYAYGFLLYIVTTLLQIQTYKLTDRFNSSRNLFFLNVTRRINEYEVIRSIFFSFVENLGHLALSGRLIKSWFCPSHCLPRDHFVNLAFVFIIIISLLYNQNMTCTVPAIS